MGHSSIKFCCSSDFLGSFSDFLVCSSNFLEFSGDFLGCLVTFRVIAWGAQVTSWAAQENFLVALVMGRVALVKFWVIQVVMGGSSRVLGG